MCFTNTPEEFFSTYVDAVGNDYFFGILELGQEGEHLILAMAELYLTMYKADAVQEQSLPEPLKAAARIVKQALGGLVVLLKPEPGVFGSSADDLQHILNAKGSSNEQLTFLSTIAVFLDDNGFWQGKLESFMQTSVATARLAPQISTVLEAMKADLDVVSTTPGLEKAIALLPEVKKCLREGAGSSLEEAIFKRLKEILSCMNEDTDADIDMGKLQFLTKAFGGLSKSEEVAREIKSLETLKGRYAKGMAGKSLTKLAEDLKTNQSMSLNPKEDFNLVSGWVASVKDEPGLTQLVPSFQVLVIGFVKSIWISQDQATKCLCLFDCRVTVWRFT